MTTPPPPPPPPAIPSDPVAAPTTYRDGDLVYVDPETKTVVGPVEWSRNGNPKSKTFVHPPSEKDEKGERRRGGRKHYPWGTYKAMKGAFKLEGKKKYEANKTLDEVLEKALKEAFWD